MRPMSRRMSGSRSGGRLRVAGRLLSLSALVLLPLAAGTTASGAARGAGASTATTASCPGQHTLATRALARSHLRVDVDGDGRLDAVATATDPTGAPACRAFVAVHLRGGQAYSAALRPPAVPRPGFRAQVVAVPDLGTDPGAEIVVDSHAMADETLAQLFTVRRSGLVRVVAPGRRDGNLVVHGGGVTYPHGATCTRHGALVLTRASATAEGRFFHVTRRTYPVRGDRLRFLAPRVSRATVSAAALTSAYPELSGGRHFRACTGRVRHVR